MDKKERKIGEFYGVHHARFGYRKKPKLHKIKFVLGDLGLSIKDLGSMTCMEAGGSGNKARSLAILGCRDVYYIDPSRENTTALKEVAQRDQLPINVIHGSILDPHDELTQKMDLIICDGVIHHTLDPALGLLHLRNWLKVGGFLTVNCYRSGTLWFFSTSLIRELMGLVEIEYNELVFLLGLVQMPLSILEFMDDALVPVLHPIDAKTFSQDLKDLGFSIIKEEDDDEGFHESAKPMLHFSAVKSRNPDIHPSSLRYHEGLNQLALDYEPSTQALIRDFFRFKKRLASGRFIHVAAILSALFIKGIVQEAKEMDGPPLWWRLRALLRTKNLRFLAWKKDPKRHFYRHLRVFLQKGLVE